MTTIARKIPDDGIAFGGPEDPRFTYGILLRILPADPTLGVEIQRAPDLILAPGPWTTLGVIAPMPIGGGTFLDILPSGSTWWYRIRHVGLAVSPSAWLQHPAGITTRVVDSQTVAAAMSNPTPGLQGVAGGQATTASISPQQVERTRIGATFVQDAVGLGSSRTRHLNGGADFGTAYWNSSPPGLLSAVSDQDTYAASLPASFRLQHNAGGAEFLFQSTDANDPNTGGDNWALFAVRPGRRIQVDYAGKVSGAGVVGRVQVAEYTATGTLVALTDIGVALTSTAWVTQSVEHTVSNATAFVVIRYGATGASAGFVWYDDLNFTDLIPINDTVLGWKDLGTISGSATIDWQNGKSQFLAIDGTSIPLFFSNAELGGVYYLYLKQSSPPDTVAWPTGLIRWKNDTIPVLSTTAGQINRIRLEWEGTTYFGEVTDGWWSSLGLDILPASIGSQESLGIPVVDRPHIDPTGIGTLEVFGVPTVESGAPQLTVVGASPEGGDVCLSQGNLLIHITWTAVNAPDAQYHIDIVGVASGLTVSAGQHVLDTGQQFNLSSPPINQATFGPYAVKLVKTVDSTVADQKDTNTVIVQFSLALCT